MKRLPAILFIVVALFTLGAGCGRVMGQDPQPELPPPVPVPETPGSAVPAPQAEPAAPPAGAAANTAPAAAASVSLPGAGNAIPQAYSEEHYASTWNRNPFLLVTTTKGPAPGPGFGEDWELRGLTRNKGLPEALLGNKKTQEFHWVKMTEDKDGFKLIKATIDRDLHKSSVEVAKSGEAGNATFTFPEQAAAPGGAPGAAGARPPAVPQPGGVARPGMPVNNNGILRPGMPAAQPQAGQQPNMNGNRPGMNQQAQPMGGGVPRMNQGFKNNSNTAMPGATPNPPGRRRVLIPSAPSS